MSKPGNELEAFSAAQAAIEPYLAGGVIESAISAPERSMDGIIQGHLANIAMLNARGDTVPERPAYIFNPDTGLLINYAYRRDSNPARTGLFADIVELDKEGKPRHGVGAVNPFATESGFIQVAVGENNNGFAPTSVTMRLDSDDPTSVEAPNVEMADLVAMLQTESIPADMPMEDFLLKQKETQDEVRAKTVRRQHKNYMPNVQAIDEATDPRLHLIVTDREDTSELEVASREIGVFPIVLTAREIISSAIAMKKISGAYEAARLSTFVSVEQDDIRALLARATPAFMTFDFENMVEKSWEEQERKMVPFPKETSRPENPLYPVTTLLSRGDTMLDKGILEASPFFSRIVNETFFPDDYPAAEKVAHGKYEMAIAPEDPNNLKNYTDLLRKMKLDYMLTLYLRGSNQL